MYKHFEALETVSKANSISREADSGNPGVIYIA